MMNQIRKKKKRSYIPGSHTFFRNIPYESNLDVTQPVKEIGRAYKKRSLQLEEPTARRANSNRLRARRAYSLRILRLDGSKARGAYS